MSKNITISYDKDKKFNAYLTAPKAKGPLPALILVHEIWGLNDHIKNVAERLSNEGYIVLAPDLFDDTEIMGKISPEIFANLQNPEKRHQAQAEMRDMMQPLSTPEFAEEALAKLRSGFSYLTIHDHSDGNIGAIGFCLGGTYVFHLATREPMLNATVVYYGQPPRPLKTVENIKSPILAFYGEKDKSLIAVLPELEETMEKFNKDFTSVVYPDAAHAFFNDTNAAAYNRVAAEDSWSKALDFLRRHLY